MIEFIKTFVLDVVDNIKDFFKFLGAGIAWGIIALIFSFLLLAFVWVLMKIVKFFGGIF
jgi:hypothetical protein